MSVFTQNGRWKGMACVWTWKILSIAERGDRPICAIPNDAITLKAFGSDDRLFKREVVTND